MYESIEVVYENGVFRPLGQLPQQLQEHQHLRIILDAPGPFAGRFDAVCLAAARKDADSTVSLQEVRRILAKVSGSLSRTVLAEREER